MDIRNIHSTFSIRIIAKRADESRLSTAMKNIIKIIFVLTVVATLFYFRAPIENEINSIFSISQKIVFPCQNPIYYSLGNFDTKFNISKTELLNTLNEAAAIWEKPIGKDLFAFSETGALKINLVYDYRQEATDRLKSLGIVIKDDRSTYDELKEKYNSFSSVYNQKKTEFNQLVAGYNIQKDAYERDVKSWNKRGGAPKDTFEKLEQEREQLNALIDPINQKQAELNNIANDINIIAGDLNQIAAKLDLVVDNYNYIGGSTGKEFEEGLYERDANGERITIYQFDSRLKLLRVLAHEFGHALGLEHTDNPNDIMYKLNEGSNEKLTANDLAQLKAMCKIE